MKVNCNRKKKNIGIRQVKGSRVGKAWRVSESKETAGEVVRGSALMWLAIGRPDVLF